MLFPSHYNGPTFPHLLSHAILFFLIAKRKTSETILTTFLTMNAAKKVWTPKHDANERVLLSSFGIPVFFQLMTTDEIERARIAFRAGRERTILLDDKICHPTRESNPRPPD